MKNLLASALVLAITPLTFGWDKQGRGGNLARIRLRSGPTNLHAFWHGLLAAETMASLR
jgi:hypothetical protein